MINVIYQNLRSHMACLASRRSGATFAERDLCLSRRAVSNYERDRQRACGHVTHNGRLVHPSLGPVERAETLGVGRLASTPERFRSILFTVDMHFCSLVLLLKFQALSCMLRRRSTSSSPPCWSSGQSILWSSSPLSLLRH